MPGPTLLIVEDEKPLVKVLRYNLERAGFRVVAAADGPGGLELFRKESPSLVILDVMLPGLDGFEVAKALRRESDTPILMLTARKNELDRVLGLELGADDYVTKPFSVRELVARIRAILKRAGPAASTASAVRAGGLEIDFGRYETKVAGREVRLSTKEFELLKCLAKADGRALTREELLERVWGAPGAELDTRTVDQHVARLRDRLGQEAARIVTVKNVGYRFKHD